MKITQLTFPQPSVCRVEVCESAARYEAVIRQFYEKRRALYPVPGYEKGQAPRRAIERVYGEEIFRLEAVNHLLLHEFPALQAELCRQRGLTPLTEPEPQLIAEDETGFTAACTFALVPEQQLCGYTGQTLPGGPQEGGKALLMQVAARCGVQPPAYAVETETRSRRDALEQKLRDRQTTLDAVLQPCGKTEAELMEDLRTGVWADLTQRIILHNIARQEGLFATPEQLEAELCRMEGIAAQNRYARSNPAARHSIAARLTHRNTVEWLRANNRFV